MIATISREQLKEKMEQGEDFVLIETLPNFAYLHGHLPGAINIPPDKVTQLAAVLIPDKRKEIIVYCSSFS